MVTNGQLRQAIMSSCLIWDESCLPEECRIYELCMKSLDAKEKIDELISDELQELLNKSKFAIEFKSKYPHYSILDNRFILVTK